MDPLDKVRSEFSRQAGDFENPNHTIASGEIVDWILSELRLDRSLEVLDVAAGTAILARAIAPRVAKVTALDATPRMLEEGRAATSKAGVTNLSFVEGLAEALPFRDAAFDLVISRLAFHHFASPEKPLDEMLRVCKPGHEVAVVDLLSPEEDALAAPYNEIEQWRDPSHTRALKGSELEGLLRRREPLDFSRAVRSVVVDFETWVALSKTPAETARKITERLRAELSGGPATGMQPFLDEKGRLQFRQTWAVMRATRGHRS